jgi:hypothetical protein
MPAQTIMGAEPDFHSIGLLGALTLPAVQRKLLNLQKLKKENPVKHAAHRAEIKGHFV